MRFPFLSRFKKQSRTVEPSREPNDAGLLEQFARKEGGMLWRDFPLYHRDKCTRIDFVLFLPTRGLYFGEKISWELPEVQNAKLERASRASKQKASTRLESTEAKIRQKLQDVLSFDSTPIERFFWMERLSEADFDSLDPSFHEHLPKPHLLFAGEDLEAFEKKLLYLTPALEKPLSATNILGALKSHERILPDLSHPFGQLLDEVQQAFLALPEGLVNTLCGPHASGKSMLLVRKAAATLLELPERPILFITPTPLSGELLRDQLLMLAEQGAFELKLGSIHFLCAEAVLSEPERLHHYSIVICDDIHMISPELGELFLQSPPTRRIWISTLECDDPLAYPLSNTHHREVRKEYLHCKGDDNHLHTFIRSQLTLALRRHRSEEIMVILPNDEALHSLQEASSPWFPRPITLTPTFTLQQESLEGIVLSTPSLCIGLSRPVVFLVDDDTIDPQGYSYALSRASESLTIIIHEKPIREDMLDENHQN